jgi:serine/threonine protein kinase
MVQENISFEKRVNEVLRQEGGHENVLALRTVFSNDGYDHFVFDFCSQGALFDVMEAIPEKQFEQHQAQAYFKQIVSGLKFIHAAGFAHRDLSLENILVDDNNACKICDFGLAVDISNRCVDPVGKPFYIAPEVFDSGIAYDPASADVWSLGIILFILLTGNPPFRVPSELDESYAYVSSFGLHDLIQTWELEDRISDDAEDLLIKMLAIDSSKRCTLHEILLHPFLSRSRPLADDE